MLKEERHAKVGRTRVRVQNKHAKGKEGKESPINEST
jgi:hypothetical protein